MSYREQLIKHILTLEWWQLITSVDHAVNRLCRHESISKIYNIVCIAIFAFTADDKTDFLLHECAINWAYVQYIVFLKSSRWDSDNNPMS